MFSINDCSDIRLLDKNGKRIYGCSIIDERIARQTISKWENGQAMPELYGRIALSELYGVTIDGVVKEDDECNISLKQKGERLWIKRKLEKAYISIQKL